MAKKRNTEETSGETTQAKTPGTVMISGISFPVDSPYAEGHVLTTAEAATLNQTRIENLRNNFSSVVKKAQEAAKAEGGPAVDTEALQAQFASYAAGYTFSGQRVARAPTDPVGAEAHKIAKARVADLLKKKSIDPKSVSKEKHAELVAGILAKYPDIRVEAQRRIDEASSIASDALDDLLDAA